MSRLMPEADSRTGTPQRGRLRRDRLALWLFAVPLVVTTLFGGLAGLVWSMVAERPELLLTPSGTAYAAPEPQAVIAADGWFAVVTAAAGTLCGVVAFLVGRRRLATRLREIAVLLGLTFGGLLASLSAWGAGHAVGLAEFQQQVRTQPAGTQVTGLLQLHAVGVVVVWSAAAVIVFTILLAVAGRSEGTS